MFSSATLGPFSTSLCSPQALSFWPTSWVNDHFALQVMFGSSQWKYQQEAKEVRVPSLTGGLALTVSSPVSMIQYYPPQKLPVQVPLGGSGNSHSLPGQWTHWSNLFLFPQDSEFTGLKSKVPKKI
jgi:hypothetical protein